MPEVGVTFCAVLSVVNSDSLGNPPSVVNLSMWLERQGIAHSMPVASSAPFVIEIDLAKSL